MTRPSLPARLGARAGLLIVGALLAACGDAAPSAGYATRDSAGVTIVDHVAIDTTVIPQFVLDGEPLLRIGVQEGDEGYQFNRIEDAELRADGSMAVLDRRAGTLRVFDSAGVLRWTTGRAGDGPGEFRAPLRVESIRGAGPARDTLVVWDGRLGRFSFFLEPEGMVHSVRVAELAAYAALIGVLGDGSAIMERRSSERTVDQGRTAMASASAILQSDTSRAQFAALESFKQPMMYQEFNDSNGAYSQAIFAAFIKFATAADGIWVGDPDRTELQRFANGSLQRLVRWGGPDRSVSSADVDALAAVWEAEANTAETRELYRRYIDTQPRAERFPAFNELLADSTGALWIQDAVPEHRDDGRRRWTRLSADGTAFEARMEHDASLRLLRVHGDRVLAVERDELDVERLVLYRMTARGAAP